MMPIKVSQVLLKSPATIKSIAMAWLMDTARRVAAAGSMVRAK